MERIYEQEKDLHIRNNLVYGKTADKKLYYDAAYTRQVTCEDLREAFKKGFLLIFDGANYLIPVSIPMDSDASPNKVKTVGAGTSAVELTEWTAQEPTT